MCQTSRTTCHANDMTWHASTATQDTESRSIQSIAKSYVPKCSITGEDTRQTSCLGLAMRGINLDTCPYWGYISKGRDCTYHSGIGSLLTSLAASPVQSCPWRTGVPPKLGVCIKFEILIISLRSLHLNCHGHISMFDSSLLANPCMIHEGIPCFAS